jgi:hypothetical protein
MKKSGELRRRAENYRRLKDRVSDRRALQAISELADEFETEAAALEKSCLVRKRAFELWLERGCPEDAISSIGSWPSGRRIREHA